MSGTEAEYGDAGHQSSFEGLKQRITTSLSWPSALRKSESQTFSARTGWTVFVLSSLYPELQPMGRVGKVRADSSTQTPVEPQR